MWQKLASGGDLPNKTERLRALGVKPNTLGKWMKAHSPTVDAANLDALTKALEQLLGSNQSESFPMLLDAKVSLYDFWKVFSEDENLLEEILDHRFLTSQKAVTPHLLFDDEEKANALAERLRGVVKVVRVVDGVEKAVPVTIRSVHRLAERQYVISVGMAVPRDQAGEAPFIYRGVVGEIFGKTLYWVLSSVSPRNTDMVFMITSSVGHEIEEWKLEGEGLTVSQNDTSKAVHFGVSIFLVSQELQGSLEKNFKAINSLLS